MDFVFCLEELDELVCVRIEIFYSLGFYDGVVILKYKLVFYKFYKCKCCVIYIKLRCMY